MELEHFDVTPSRIILTNPSRAGKKSKDKKAHEIYADGSQFYLVLENGNKQATITIHHPIQRIDVGKIFFLEGIWERTEKGNVIIVGTCSQYWNTMLNGNAFEWHIYRPEEAKGKGKTKFRVRCWDIDLDREEKYQLGKDLVFQSIIRKVITDKDEKKKKEYNSDTRNVKRGNKPSNQMREPLCPFELVQDFSSLRKLNRNEINDARNSYTIKSAPNLQNRRKRPASRSLNPADIQFTESSLSIPIKSQDEEKVAMRKKIEELQDENTKLRRGHMEKDKMINDKDELIRQLMEQVRMLCIVQSNESSLLLGSEDVLNYLTQPYEESQKEANFVKIYDDTCNRNGVLRTEISNFEDNPDVMQVVKAVSVLDFPKTTETAEGSIETSNYTVEGSIETSNYTVEGSIETSNYTVEGIDCNLTFFLEESMLMY